MKRNSMPATKLSSRSNDIALDLNNTVKRAYRIFGPPATFFIDGRGIIRDVVLGPITPDRAREAMKKIQMAAKI